MTGGVDSCSASPPGTLLPSPPRPCLLLLLLSALLRRLSLHLNARLEFSSARSGCSACSGPGPRALCAAAFDTSDAACGWRQDAHSVTPVLSANVRSLVISSPFSCLAIRQEGPEKFRGQRSGAVVLLAHETSPGGEGLAVSEHTRCSC